MATTSAPAPRPPGCGAGRSRWTGRRTRSRRWRIAIDRAYEAALRAIVADFESREQHVTGVPIADTALMAQRIAAGRGMAVEPASPLLPG